MTHTLHRRGSAGSLKDDYVVMQLATVGINNIGAAPKQKVALEIMLKHNPVNWTNLDWGSKFKDGYTRAIEHYDSSVDHIDDDVAVFRSKEDFEACVAELKAAKLGLSVVVSGLFDQLLDSLHKLGLNPHTVQYSLGTFGNLDRLPPENILEITTMCGHHCVSPALVLRMIRDIKRRRISTEEASRALAKPCVCGVFNPSRAERLLEEIITPEPR